MGIEKAITGIRRSCCLLVQSFRNPRVLISPRRISTFVQKDPPETEKTSKFGKTFVAKWAEYWTAVYSDYKDVTLDTVKTVKEKPIKGILYAVCIGAAIYLASKNPDEQEFRDAYLNSCNEFIFVSPAIRNPDTEFHLKSIESYYNQGIIERISFGMFSVIWIKDYSSQVALYKSLCQYLTPALATYRARVVDIGFLGRWWILENIMENCDVNRLEWEE